MLETCLAVRSTAQELHRWLETRRQTGGEQSVAELLAAAQQMVTAAQQARVSQREGGRDERWV